MSKKRVLFLTLKIFSVDGGIEKVCRIVGKVLNEISIINSLKLSIYSMHDSKKIHKNIYFPINLYTPFSGKKFSFGIQSIIEGFKSDVLILSHVNLLLFGYLIKFFSPSKKLVLFAHGIEVWEKFSDKKNKWLQQCDTIICVSNFTKQKMIALHGIEEVKCVVVNNCIDPYLPRPLTANKSEILLKKYNLSHQNTILLTLSRLSAHDRPKGYDKVLKAVAELKIEFPSLVYMIAGKYDAAEKLWLDEIIVEKGLQNAVVFTGYVADDELADHFTLADMYVMPSTKEGFGIIFVEAMYYGLPVIAGNNDGSVDALANGKFGLLVDPDNQKKITEAIRKVIVNRQEYIPDHEELMQQFGYETYKKHLLQVFQLN